MSMCFLEKSIVPYAVRLMNSTFLVQLSCAFEFQYAANFLTVSIEKLFCSYILSSMFRNVCLYLLLVIEYEMLSAMSPKLKAWSLRLTQVSSNLK